MLRSNEFIYAFWNSLSRVSAFLSPNLAVSMLRTVQSSSITGSSTSPMPLTHPSIKNRLPRFTPCNTISSPYPFWFLITVPSAFKNYTAEPRVLGMLHLLTSPISPSALRFKARTLYHSPLLAFKGFLGYWPLYIISHGPSLPGALSTS